MTTSSDQAANGYHPAHHAVTLAHQPACIIEPSGVSLSYGQLEEHANRCARLFRAAGCAIADTIAIMLENRADFFIVAWGAQRAGLVFTCVSTRLASAEAQYILNDCGAKLLVTSSAVAMEMSSSGASATLFNIGPSRVGYVDFNEALAAYSPLPLPDQAAGVEMLYSSGTTGQPKGIRRPAPAGPFDTPDDISAALITLNDFGPGTVYLCPAPLYHAAPLRWSMAVQRAGGTVIVMEKFDAERALHLIERHRVNFAQFVPTHFIRMLKLNEAIRARYDMSSLRKVVHAGAPCPVATKAAMIAWFGPIIEEYYSGSEGFGVTYIDANEWMAKKGSVGRPLGCDIHICDDAGNVLPAGQTGTVYFGGASNSAFAYHNDPEKTAAIRNRHGWTTLGDIGHLDADGYLFLTDRKAFMIISGGVNIYPQEIENILIQHQKIADVAVIGAPDEEMGEQVVAVVEPAAGIEPGADLAAEIMHYARARMSHVKCPRRVDFLPQLPRHDTGKLYKLLIRDTYWAKT